MTYNGLCMSSGTCTHFQINHTACMPLLIHGVSKRILLIIKYLNKMVTKKEWSEFRSTGLLLFINQILHVFGWAIVFDVDGDEVKSVYPARVKFRGFDNDSVSKSYQKISEYMKENASELSDEANS